MALARWQATITDEAGNILPAASVTVRRETVGAPLANLFSDRDGLVPIGNPFTADGDAYAAFHAVGGAYRITATLGSASREWRYVAVGLGGESDEQPPGVGFYFDDGTTDADPGSGGFRFNNATPASATKLFVSQTSPEGLDVGAWLASFDDGGLSTDRGLITIQGGNGAAVFIARISGAVTDDGVYYDIPVSVIASTAADSFVVDRKHGISFSPRGVDGVLPGLLFAFDSSTSMADPGVGDFRLNNATLASVTAAAFDDQSAIGGNPDVSAIVLSWDDSTSSVRGYLTIKDATAPQNFAVYSITGASTDNSGWTQLALTHVASSGSFTNGNTCIVEFSRSGDTGTVVGKQSIWVDAASMRPRITSGAQFATIDSGSADNTLEVLDFDQTTSEHAQFKIAMPKSWNEGTVTFTPYWTAGAGTAAQTCIFALAGAAISNDDVLNATMGTAQSSSDALIATGDLHIGPESSAITIGGTPAELDLVIFNISRDISDTLAADARLIGIMLHITLNANTDA